MKLWAIEGEDEIMDAMRRYREGRVAAARELWRENDEPEFDPDLDEPEPDYEAEAEEKAISDAEWGEDESWEDDPEAEDEP